MDIVKTKTYDEAVKQYLEADKAHAKAVDQLEDAKERNDDPRMHHDCDCEYCDENTERQVAYYDRLMKEAHYNAEKAAKNLRRFIVKQNKATA